MPWSLLAVQPFLTFTRRWSALWRFGAADICWTQHPDSVEELSLSVHKWSTFLWLLQPLHLCFGAAGYLHCRCEPRLVLWQVSLYQRLHAWWRAILSLHGTVRLHPTVTGWATAGTIQTMPMWRNANLHPNCCTHWRAHVGSDCSVSVYPCLTRYSMFLLREHNSIQTQYSIQLSRYPFNCAIVFNAKSHVQGQIKIRSTIIGQQWWTYDQHFHWNHFLLNFIEFIAFDIAIDALNLGASEISIIF